MAEISERHAPPTGYIDGTMETRRFAHRREAYWKGIDEIIDMGIAPADLIHHAPAFAGHVNLARYLALYEAYKMTLPLAGHVAPNFLCAKLVYKILSYRFGREMKT